MQYGYGCWSSSGLFMQCADATLPATDLSLMKVHVDSNWNQSKTSFSLVLRKRWTNKNHRSSSDLPSSSEFHFPTANSWYSWRRKSDDSTWLGPADCGPLVAWSKWTATRKDFCSQLLRKKTPPFGVSYSLRCFWKFLTTHWDLRILFGGWTDC